MMKFKGSVAAVSWDYSISVFGRIYRLYEKLKTYVFGNLMRVSVNA